MNIRALLFLVAALPALAAEIILPSQISIYNDATLGNQLNHGDASLCATMPASSFTSSTLGFSWDTTANFVANNSLANRTGLTAGTLGVGATGCLPVKGLPANTAITACVVLTDGANATVCTSSGNANSRVAFTTPAAPTIDPALPTLPNITFDDSYPAGVPAIGSGHDFPVASNCSNLNSQVTAARAAAEGDSQIRAVTIPYTNSCAVITALSSSSTHTWVIIRTDQEPVLTPPGVRIPSTYSSLMPTITVSTAGGSFTNLVANSYVRFVGIRVIFNDGTAFSGAGNPTLFHAWLINARASFDHVVWDRCIFDGQGYPFRIAAVFEFECDGAGVTCTETNWSFTDCAFPNIYNWYGWMSGLTATASTKTLTQSGTYYVGRGDQVCTIGPWSVTTTDSSTVSWQDVVDSSCTHKVYYASGSAPTVTGAVTVVSGSPGTSDFRYDNRGLEGIAMGTTSGNWNVTGGNPLYWWGTSGLGPGLIVSGESDSFVIDGEYNDPNTLNLNNVIFRRNKIVGAGILLLFESAGPTHDILIDRNDTSAPSGCSTSIAPGPTSSPFACDTRYPYELKNGYSVAITGNTHHNWYADGYPSRDTDGSWFSLKPDKADQAGSYTGDIYIANNTATQSVGCFYISTEPNNGTGIWLTPKPIRRVQIFNNVCLSDAYAFTSYWGKYGLGVPNNGFSMADQGAIDLTITHNFFQGRNPAGGMQVFEAHSHGVSIINNLLSYMNNSGQYHGLQSGFYGTNRWSAKPLPDFGWPSGSGGIGIQEGTSALSKNVLSVYQYSNLLYAGCVTADSSCTNSTTTLVSSPLASYPAGSTWVTGANLGTVYSNVKWNKFSGSPAPPSIDLRLHWDSSGISGASPRLATDGLDMGPDMDALNAAQGQVLNARVRPNTITTTGASISFYAPDTWGCPVDYSTSPTLSTFTRVANAGGSRFQDVAITGLTTGTTYYARIQCAIQQPVVSFATH
jgi:hypothetical protein